MKPGFAWADDETPRLYQSYRGDRRAFYVIEASSGRIVGGAGIAPLDGGAPNTCELRKMYFLKAARGKGLGREMLRLCLKTAKGLGYTRCYLETLARMRAARRLYEKSGFRQLGRPMGATGHFACDAWYLKRLR